MNLDKVIREALAASDEFADPYDYTATSTRDFVRDLANIILDRYILCCQLDPLNG